MQASGLNVLSAQEVRDALIHVLGWEVSSKLPTEDELGLMILAQTKADEAAADASSQATQDQSNPSYGDNSNRQDAGGQHAYNPDNG